jgi:adenine deaminase
MDYSYTKTLCNTSLGIEKSDLVLKNGKVINVFSNEIIKCDIAIQAGIIVGLGQYNGRNEIDVEGKYICPGLIDSHLHMESTLVKPAQLVHRAGLYGTTTFIVDPHEAANVSGKKGIDFILEQTEDLQANVFVMIPSCVPATSFEDNGYTMDATDMQEYLNNPRVLGLGEVMDCKSVLAADPKIIAKLKLFQHKTIDGHAGYLSDKETACYTLAGIKTDHECS